MKKPFRKPATTYAEQVELLISRGMIIDDRAEAMFYLQHLNYYRLGAYWLPFEAHHSPHRFRPDTRFAEVLASYMFDRELRLLVMDALERTEVSVRSQWAYQLARNHGPHAHLDPELARNRSKWEENLLVLEDEVKRSKEPFIRHLTRNYEEILPPIWAVCEVLTLGQLSRWYGVLGPMSTRRAIANVYALDETVVGSWLHHLTHVRNICAHHNRLWNREFTITPMAPKTKPSDLARQFNGNSRRVYNTLVVLLYFMDRIAPRHNWRVRLKDLLGGANDLGAMGFPNYWQDMPIWSAAGA